MESAEIPTTLPLESNNSPVKKMCIDDMLQNYCGEFGRWQLKHFVLTSLAWVLAAFHSMLIIFADRQPLWRCLHGSAGYGCNAAAGSVCGLKPGSWEWIGGRGGSTVSEWGLICGEKFKVGLVHALFFVGSMIGAGVFGHLSDSFLGRKRTLGVVCTLNAIFGCLTPLTHNYFTYVLLRLLTGFSTGGVGLCAFVLATEPIGPKKRGTAGMSTFYFFSGGIALLSGIAYIFQTWRYLYIASSIPSFLYVILVLPFLSESPRWYLVRGRVTEATKIMSAIASYNGKHFPSGFLLALDEEVEKNNDNERLENKGARVGSIVEVVRSPVTRVRLLIAVALNFFGSLVYYGLSLNVVNLRMNLYLNVLVNAVGEMPAFMITAVLLDRFGRKPLTVATMWFSGVFCLMGSLVGNVGVWKVVRMVCGVLGIFGMAGTYNLLFIYTAELFPTVVRNAALGSTTQAAQMGAILAPFVVVLGGWLPFAVFAACGMIGGAFAFFLPETLNQPLYDTFSGLEGGVAG
ncbi:organic cation/carnitine transporter 4-like [Abrus precatorius]|uniref:Organic cation/carnitine transporter 4-like n=1 Tax=Abrus precatorius TaxID=3816 RepID=A0A8B8KMJ8_ABRPR|nr:organic cation/carnitine transporter 4-like [Abrus precatorius]